MEDIGKNSLTDTSNVFCKQCEDENKRVPANGLCRECDENMCIACFGGHKKYKVCRDHVMVDIDRKPEPKIDREEDAFVPCPKHIKEQLKFYCTCHEDVGCGDCMILYHKTCKVDYIADLSAAFSDSKKFVDTAQHVSACQAEVNVCLESIQNNSRQVGDIYQQFISEMKSFRDELMSKLDQQELILLENAKDVHEKEKHDLVSLEAEFGNVKNNLAQLHNTISSNCSETNLFINTIQSKRTIKEIQCTFNKLKSKNTISKYKFQRSSELDELFKEIELGGIHVNNDDETHDLTSEDCKGYEVPVTSRTPAGKQDDVENNVTASLDDGYEKPITSKNRGQRPCDSMYEVNMSLSGGQDYDDLIYEEIPQSKITRRRSSSKRKSWSLFENQMRCENILMAGEIVSLKDNNKGDNGLFVGKRSIKAGTYFEVEILNTTDQGNISIGFVSKDNSSNEQPGDGRFSMGYHSGDGGIHCDSASNKRISPTCKTGDIIGIGVSSYLSNVFKTNIIIFVTRNSQKIGSMDINNPSFCKLYPAVGLKAINDKGRVVMNAELP